MKSIRSSDQLLRDTNICRCIVPNFIWKVMREFLWVTDLKIYAILSTDSYSTEILTKSEFIFPTCTESRTFARYLPLKEMKCRTCRNTGRQIFASFPRRSIRYKQYQVQIWTILRIVILYRLFSVFHRNEVSFEQFGRSISLDLWNPDRQELISFFAHFHSNISILYFNS